MGDLTIENVLRDLTFTTAKSLAEDAEQIKLAYRENSTKLKLAEMAAIFGAARGLKEQIENALDHVNEMITAMSSHDIPALFYEDPDNPTQKITNSYGTIHLTQRFSASIQDKEAAFEWMRANGFGDLIQPAVNAQTLSAALKEFDREPGPDVIKTSRHTMAVLRAKTGKAKGTE